jgi:hypothetical protein
MWSITLGIINYASAGVIYTPTGVICDFHSSNLIYDHHLHS